MCSEYIVSRGNMPYTLRSTSLTKRPEIMTLRIGSASMWGILRYRIHYPGLKSNATAATAHQSYQWTKWTRNEYCVHGTDKNDLSLMPKHIFMFVQLSYFFRAVSRVDVSLFVFLCEIRGAHQTPKTIEYDIRVVWLETGDYGKRSAEIFPRLFNYFRRLLSTR